MLLGNAALVGLVNLQYVAVFPSVEYFTIRKEYIHRFCILGCFNMLQNQ